ncbi:metalloregulator ArsR/SmtB family transcription factor [Brevibacillus sp. SYSU BS000544]|uniref:DUF2087 domain-containing protein n=1 Tax=Brevibacillus sp. SYSU BS000544 TaxID=3416443 RepID=UPI003CE533A6
MQIDLLVQFHKALSDVSRIRILALLARKPMSGTELAERLGLTPATITHHTQKLKKVGIVKEKRDKNTITFYLLARELGRYAESTISTIIPADASVLEEWEVRRSDIPDEASEMKMIENDVERIIAPFFMEDGKLKQIPSQWKKRRYVLEKLVASLDFGKQYTEKEISDYLKWYHDDYATLRRELIMNHIMFRENGIYTLNPRELWKSAE